MKTSSCIFGAALLAVSAFVSCSRTPDIVGTWHYQKMSQTVYGAAADTMYLDLAAKKDSVQYYDVYRPDGVLEFYMFDGDSLTNRVEFRYIVRNDTVFVENEQKKTFARLVEVTDSVMLTDYTRVRDDTTYYFRALSRRSGLPLL